MAAYELFDEKGKISKSKGNGISIDQWLRYASPEVCLYICTQIRKEFKNFMRKLFLKQLMNICQVLKNFKSKKKDKILNPGGMHNETSKKLNAFFNAIKFSWIK